MAAGDLGKFQLGELISRGGMGELYRARYEGPGGFIREVALKIVRPDVKPDQKARFAEMFIEEAKILGQLNHGNLIHIYDFGEDGETLFMSMELVHGADLARIIHQRHELRSGQLPVRYVLRIIEQVAQGLDYAHRLTAKGESLGLVHRDVSPSNILVSYDGAVKLADFGVARIQRASPLTQGGVVKGKTGYMAPEYLSTQKADRRADVFSLGVVLWEGLTGKRLFGDRDAAARKAHILEGVIEPPSKATPGLPVALDAIVLRALERKPDDRFQTTRELAASLTEFGLANRLLADDVDLGKELRRLFPAGVPATALDFRGLTRATPIDAVPQDVLPPEQLARSSDTGPTPVAIESGDILPSSAPSSASDLTAAKITDVMPAQRAILDSPPDVAEVPSVTEVPTEPERLRPELPAEVSVQPAPPVKGGRGWQATTAVAMGLALLAGGFAWRRQHPSPAATPAPPATITPAEIPAPATPSPATPSPATPSPATRPSVERVTPSPLPGERAGLRGPQVTPTKEPSPTPPAVHHPIPPRHHPKPGTLAVIAVRPWVQVFVDGTSRGYSPAPAIPITAGRHKITLSNDEAHLSRTFSVVVPEAGRVVFRGDAKTLQPAF